MITDFEGCRRSMQNEDIRRYLYEMCEKLNVAFSFLETEITQRVKYEDGTATPDSIVVNGGEAEIGSHGEVICKSLKTNTLEAYSDCNLNKLSLNGLSLPNGIGMDSSGLKIKELWTADNAEEYIGTGDNFHLSADAQKYRFFLARVSAENGAGQANTYIPCIRLGNYIRGSAGYCTADELQLFICNFTLNGTSAQTVAVKAYYPLTGQLKNRKITRFYAVI